MVQTQGAENYSGNIPSDPNTKAVQQQPAGQSITMQPQTSPEAQTTEGDTGQTYQPSSVGTQSGFPLGRQTSANPMVEQAVQDFQGGGAVGGGTGVDNEQPLPKKPGEKKRQRCKKQPETDEAPEIFLEDEIFEDDSEETADDE